MSVAESYELRDERLATFPEQFKSGILSLATASDLGDRSSWSKRPSAIQAPVWQFSAHKIKLFSKRPISVRMSRGERLFLAENEKLGIFTTGESVQEAINEFAGQLIHFYRHYKNLGLDHVTGAARELKELYDDLFEEIS